MAVYNHRNAYSMYGVLLQCFVKREDVLASVVAHRVERIFLLTVIYRFVCLPLN